MSVLSDLGIADAGTNESLSRVGAQLPRPRQQEPTQALAVDHISGLGRQVGPELAVGAPVGVSRVIDGAHEPVNQGWPTRMSPPAGAGERTVSRDAYHAESRAAFLSLFGEEAQSL